MKMTPRSMLAVATVASLTGSTADAQTIRPLETLVRIPSVPTGVSVNGTVVVGSSSSPLSWYASNRAFRWTASEGMADLGTLPAPMDFGADALALSSDGTIVVGRSWNDSASGIAGAFRWALGSGMQSIGKLPGHTNSTATGTSANGSVVVGWSGSDYYPNTGSRAFRWTAAGGMQNLGVLAGATRSEALAVSGDGATVVGVSTVSYQSSRAFRWTASRGMQNLGALGGDPLSSATATNGDGTVVVGWSAAPSTNRQRAFRWTVSGGMVDLGTLPGDAWAYAHGVSSDGTVVIGKSTRSGTEIDRAYRWTQATGMQPLGTLPGDTESEALSISPDGSVIVGRSWGSASNPEGRAFRWTQSGGMQDLGALTAPYTSRASALSANGGVVVGVAQAAGESWGQPIDRAFRWTTAGGMTDLGVLEGGDASGATAARSDGAVVVGWSSHGTGTHAFRWTTAGMVSLGSLSDGAWSWANGLSADGAVVVGFSETDMWGRAFRWTQAGGMANLGTLPGHLESEAAATNDDGTVVVGWSASATASRAFRWTASGGMTNLGTLPGAAESEALAVSADGGAVVGCSWSGTSGRAFRWTQVTGLQDLGTLPGDTWAEACAVSADGTVVVGRSWSAANGYRTFRWTPTSGIARLETFLTSRGLSYSSLWSNLETVAISADGQFACGEGTINGAQQAFRVSLGTRLPAPIRVRASDGTLTTGVTVTWSAVTGATGYKILRSQGSGVATQVGTTSGTVLAFTDTTALPATAYNYVVRASSAAGDSEPSVADPGWRNTAPPASVVASDGTSAAHVAVTWTAAAGATGYKVFRGIGGGTPAQVGATLPAGTLSLNDGTAAAGTAYSYSVKAVNAVGDSSLSAANAGWRNVTATASDGTSALHVSVTWTAVSGATAYKVFRSNGTAVPTTLIGSSATTSYADATAVPATIYNYAVKAVIGGADAALSGANTGFRAASAGMPGGEGSGAGANGATGAPASAAISAPRGSSPASGGASSARAATVAGVQGRVQGTPTTGAWLPATCELVSARLRLMQRATHDPARAADLSVLLAPAAADDAPVPAATAPIDGCMACRLLAGDVTLDGRTDPSDLAAWFDAWSRDDWRSTDLDRDGTVDYRDLAQLLHGLAAAAPAPR